MDLIKMYKTAAEVCIKSYKVRKDLGSTEYLLELFENDGELWQALVIPGTDELVDWFKNLNPSTIAGMKKASVEAALDIRIDARDSIDPNVPLVVIGHSKGAATALVYHKIWKADYCIAFCPARCFREQEQLDNCTLFIDPDDAVPKLGFIRFKLPKCKIMQLPKDHLWFRVSDHLMKHIKEYTDEL